MNTKKPTIKEIAKMADVSPATVSLVINNKSGVGEQTRRKVLKILEMTQYIPTRSPLRIPLTFIFIKYKEHGMIVEENQGFITAIIEYIEYFCTQKNIQLITKVADKYNFEATISSQEIRQADGAFILGTELNNRQITFLQNLDFPNLILDNSCKMQPLNSVVMNNESIVYQAIEHLYLLGHRKIGYLSSSVEISNFVERREGFFAALRKFGMQMSCRFLLKPTLQGAYIDAKAQLKDETNLPSAFFADNDTIAIGAIKAFQEHGLKIPDDISIIGIDDIPYSSVATPALSTVRIERRAIAEFAVSSLVQFVDSFQNNHPFPPVKIFIEGQLIPRDSTSSLRNNLPTFK